VSVLRKDVDPDEEAKFLKNMEELKKKKRKLDEDLNEFDFQKLGKNNNKTSGKEDIPVNTTTNKSSRSGGQNKPLSPPTSVVGGGGTYIQTEGSPKRRRGSK